MNKLGKKQDNLNNQKINYKFIKVKNLIDKGQRGENVLLHNKLLGEAGYTNHRGKLVDQLRVINQV